MSNKQRPEQGRQTRQDLPPGAVDLGTLPVRFRRIIERVHARDVSELRRAERAVSVLGDKWAVIRRPYIPGELYPERPPQDAVVLTMLLVPGRPPDDEVLRVYCLDGKVTQPCLFRVVSWLGASGLHFRLTPLSASEVKGVRR